MPAAKSQVLLRRTRMHQAGHLDNTNHRRPSADLWPASAVLTCTHPIPLAMSEQNDSNNPAAVVEPVHQIGEDKWQAMVTVKNQTIGVGPLCDTKDECRWWCAQFKIAMRRAGARFSRLSPTDS